MSKLIRDGKVAVVYSPGFGAGWYTWNQSSPDCLFDSDIALIVLGEKEGNIKEIAKNKWGDGFYCGSNVSDLTVEWLPVGTPFRIDEYDGSEAIITGVEFDLTA